MFKKKYYVNNIEGNDINAFSNQQVIGLYRGGSWKGKGHCCGWYSEEYMRGAVLLGYFIIESSLSIEKGKAHIKEVVLKRPKRYRKLSIDSIYGQHKVIAQNDKEALEKFFKEDWETIAY